MTLDGKSEEKSIENNHFAENLIVRGSCHAHFKATGLILGPRGRSKKGSFLERRRNPKMWRGLDGV